jgi:hypothetical protein
MKTRRSLFSLLPFAATPLLAQGPQINASSQVKNLPPSGTFDNWVPVATTGAVNGTNATFTLASGVWRKIRVFLNGELMAQAAQVTPSNYTWNVGSVLQTITFTSPIPQAANGSGPADWVYVEGTL